MLTTALQRPHQLWLRKAAFQIHLWASIAIGLYILVVSLSGTLLLFRPELQGLMLRQYFDIPSSETAQATAPAIVRELNAAYPGSRVSGIDWPTDRRDSFLSYVSRGTEFRTVFSHPETGKVLGEMPGRTWLRLVQNLHFDLLGGRTGRTINGYGAIVILALCLTGLVVWWPGIARWRQALTIDTSRGWRRMNWDAHSAVGFWLFLLLANWALTGIFFAFPQPFRAAVNAVSPLTVVRAPASNPALKGSVPPPDPYALIARARQAAPAARLGRFVYPTTDRAAFLVLLARETHGDLDRSDEVSFYYDQYTGALLARQEQGPRSGGDVALAWIGPIHFGTFGGTPVKVLWMVLALSFPLLVVTGTLMWWNRVLSDRWRR